MCNVSTNVMLNIIGATCTKEIIEITIKKQYKTTVMIIIKHLTMNAVTSHLSHVHVYKLKLWVS